MRFANTINADGYIPPYAPVHQQTLAEYAERLRLHNSKAYAALQAELDEHFAQAAARTELAKRFERAGLRMLAFVSLDGVTL